MADTEEARAAEARLRMLATHKAATEAVYEGLEAELKRRTQPHRDTLARIAAAIETLKALGEAEEAAIEKIEDEMRPAIAAAEADTCAAFDAYWAAREAVR
jgi:predicted  nucleic acid-binding Zn-ribbon protein